MNPHPGDGRSDDDEHEVALALKWLLEHGADTVPVADEAVAELESEMGGSVEQIDEGEDEDLAEIELALKQGTLSGAVAVPLTEEAVAALEAELAADALEGGAADDAVGSPGATSATSDACFPQTSGATRPTSIARPRGDARAPHAGGRLLRLMGRPVPAAAAILLALATGALAGGLLLAPRVRLVSSATRADAGSWSTRGFQFESLGIPTTSSVRAEMSFERGGAEVGTLFVVSRTEDSGILLGAFDERGAGLWTSDERWPEESRRLRHDGVALRSLRPVITPTPRAELDDCGLLIAGRARRSLVALFDPADGTRYWSFICDGNFVFSDTKADAVVTLPGQPWSVRPVLLGGALGEGILAEPVLLVVRSDGTVAQQLVFPVLDRGRERDVHVTGIRANWRAAPTRVVVQTSEGLHFHFDVTDGRLATESAKVMRTDNLVQRLTERYGAAEVERLLAALGGPERWRESLRSSIREVPFSQRAGW